MAKRPGNPSARAELIGLPQGELYRGGQIGKYEILTQLSVGGMAELFLAFTTGPGGFKKFVVIKRILPDAQANDNFVRMFFDEARITAALNHPNIAQVFDLGDDNGPYLAMEFIAGQNLNQVSAACLKRRRALPVGFSLAVTRDLCLALHHAHTFVDPSGRPFPIIHRDVAQKNVMVTYDGVVKLLDFGIAKTQGSLGRTNAGMVKGTTGYMSPEQVRGEALDGRSDVFSAGVMLHELLTGRRLFAAETETEEMERILLAPIPRPSELVPAVPQRVSDVVMQALARNRSDRIPSARAMAKALEVAGGKLLIDQDGLASFMRELFERKMEATRALLESAGQEEASLHARSAASALTEDTGLTFPEGAGISSPPVAAERTEDSLPRIRISSSGAGSRLGAVLPVSLAALVLLGAVVTYLLIGRLMPSTSADPELLSLQGESPTPGATFSPLPATGRESPAARALKGTLTLITLPECEVFGGGDRSLGRTPLFDVPLPVGTHRMRLKGPDGVVRVLSAPIRAGRNTAYRLPLEELPAEQN